MKKFILTIIAILSLSAYAGEFIDKGNSFFEKKDYV